MAITYNNLYLNARRKLLRAGVTAAALEARELICFAAGKTKESFFRDMCLYVPAHAEQRAGELLERRILGEPVAYIIGEWDFYGLRLDISRDVLVPRVDTEQLAGRAVALAQKAGEGARVLDLCAGSGCVGLAAAANAPGCRVTLADWSEAAMRICKQNVRRNHLTAQITAFPVNALEYPPSALMNFDIIVCNPPYIPTEDCKTLDESVLWEPQLALDGGEDGLLFYRAITEKWSGALRLGGTLLFEVGIGQADAVKRLMAENGFDNICAYPDDQGISRVVEGMVVQNITRDERGDIPEERPRINGGHNYGG
ncbi:MAG: peptide chain release factor N(5)-glutamine methyltransferase [Oscillospiraceae bacterium]|nr:peptide chain release factor N(5)-glutamine methyltransferase [Oscillospiraceae bacterium]